MKNGPLVVMKNGLCWSLKTEPQVVMKNGTPVVMKNDIRNHFEKRNVVMKNEIQRVMNFGIWF